MSERVRAERASHEGGLLWGPEGFVVHLTLGAETVGRVELRRSRVGDDAAAILDAFIDQVNTEPLPDGVYRSGAEFYMPSIWRGAVPPGWRVAARGDRGVNPPGIFEVEPVPPAPATERVPWQQSIGRKLPNGKPIIGADETPIQPRVKVGPVSRASYRFVDADGAVEVLSLPEGEQL